MSNERYYAYADGSYRSTNGNRIGKAKAFMMGLPSEMSHYLLILALVCVPVTFFAPAIMSFLRKQESRKRNGFRVKHGMTKAWRRCLCLLLAYLMLIDPVCLQQLAQASSQYQNISTGDWGSGNRTSEYAYDANGSCVSKITKETSTGAEVERVTYEYNLRNKLARMTKQYTDWEGDIVEVVSYTYNDDGMLVKWSRYVTINGGEPTGGDGRDYIIDPFNHTGYPQVLEGSDGTYTIGDDVYTQAGYGDYFGYDTKHFIYDGHGSTRQLTDNTGAVIYDQVFNYDGYGVRLGYASEYYDGPQTSLLYAGEYYDTYSRQYNLRARYYDPLNGRFNQMDSFAGNSQDPQSLHKYLYAHNNPVNRIDPSGNFSIGFNLPTVIAVMVTIAVIAVIWRGANYRYYRGLDNPNISDRDIVNRIRGFETAKNILDEELNTEPTPTPEQLEQRLEAKGVYQVGEMGIGVVGRGTTLPLGERLIIEYFESFLWNLTHLQANRHPGPMIGGGDSPEYAYLWGKAESERMKIIINELRGEARRRGIAGY